MGGRPGQEWPDNVFFRACLSGTLFRVIGLKLAPWQAVICSLALKQGQKGVPTPLHPHTGIEG